MHADTAPSPPYESASAICPYIFFVLRNAPSNTGTAHDAGDSADLNSRFIMTKLCGLAGFKDRAEDGTYSSARNSLSGLDATISENSGLATSIGFFRKPSGESRCVHDEVVKGLTGSPSSWALAGKPANPYREPRRGSVP